MAHVVPSSQSGPLTAVITSLNPQLLCNGRVPWLPAQQTYSREGFMWIAVSCSIAGGPGTTSRPKEVLLKPKQFPSFPKEGCTSPGVEKRGWEESFTPSKNLLPWRGKPWWSRCQLQWRYSCSL